MRRNGIRMREMVRQRLGWNCCLRRSSFSLMSRLIFVINYVNSSGSSSSAAASHNLRQSGIFGSLGSPILVGCNLIIQGRPPPHHFFNGVLICALSPRSARQTIQGNPDAHERHGYHASRDPEARRFALESMPFLGEAPRLRRVRRGLLTGGAQASTQELCTTSPGSVPHPG